MSNVAFTGRVLVGLLARVTSLSVELGLAECQIGIVFL